MIVGLGPDCQTKFQINRWLHALGTPPHLTSFKSVFDVQRTPTSAVLAYFQHNFSGMFELEDLVRGPVSILNGRFGTSHLHRFPAATHQEHIATHYARARWHHEKSCSNMRLLLSQPQSLLFVVGHPFNPDETDAFHRQLKKHGAHGRLICVNNVGVEPTPGRDPWMGNDDHWDAALNAGMASNKRVFHYPRPK